MRLTLHQIEKKLGLKGIDVEFDAKIGNKKYRFMNPIQTLAPDWDYQILIIPYKGNELSYDKGLIRYFKYSFNFNVCE